MDPILRQRINELREAGRSIEIDSDRFIEMEHLGAHAEVQALNQQLKSLRAEFKTRFPQLSDPEITAKMQGVWQERIVLGVYGTGSKAKSPFIRCPNCYSIAQDIVTFTQDDFWQMIKGIER